MTYQEIAPKLKPRWDHVQSTVVYKALTVTHRLMMDGDKKFFESLSRRAQNIDKSRFRDEVQDRHPELDLNDAIRRYSDYLVNCLTLAFNRQFGIERSREADCKKFIGKLTEDKLVSHLETVFAQNKRLIRASHIKQRDVSSTMHFALAKDTVKIFDYIKLVMTFSTQIVQSRTLDTTFVDSLIAVFRSLQAQGAELKPWLDDLVKRSVAKYEVFQEITDEDINALARACGRQETKQKESDNSSDEEEKQAKKKKKKKKNKSSRRSSRASSMQQDVAPIQQMKPVDDFNPRALQQQQVQDPFATSAVQQPTNDLFDVFGSHPSAQPQQQQQQQSPPVDDLASFFQSGPQNQKNHDEPDNPFAQMSLLE